MDKTRYRAHYGGTQPVDDGVRVEVVFRDGSKTMGGNAKWWRCAGEDWWKWEGLEEDNIVAYRVIDK